MLLQDLKSPLVEMPGCAAAIKTVIEGEERQSGEEHAERTGNGQDERVHYIKSTSVLHTTPCGCDRRCSEISPSLDVGGTGKVSLLRQNSRGRKTDEPTPPYYTLCREGEFLVLRLGGVHEGWRGCCCCFCQLALSPQSARRQLLALLGPSMIGDNL